MGFLLIVGDAGLRSALAARLTLAGATVTTASNLDEPAVHRSQPGRTVLVLDEAGLSTSTPSALEALQHDARWERIVILSAEAAPAQADRFVYVSKSEAAGALERFLPRRQ